MGGGVQLPLHLVEGLHHLLSGGPRRAWVGAIVGFVSCGYSCTVKNIGSIPIPAS